MPSRRARKCGKLSGRSTERLSLTRYWPGKVKVGMKPLDAFDTSWLVAFRGSAGTTLIGKVIRIISSWARRFAQRAQLSQRVSLSGVREEARRRELGGGEIVL